MSRKNLSKEEILKQFDLPERKSKIATLMKQDDIAYCICRSSDSSRFMIGCDACEEWYHGDCIGISEKVSKDIKRYYCDRCRQEDPSLVTRYKSTKTDAEKRVEKTKEKRCETCSNCNRRDNCGRCPGCKSGFRCLHRVCLQTRTREKDKSPEWAPPPKKRKSVSPEPKRGKEKRRGGRPRAEVKEAKPHRGRKRKDSLDEEEEVEERYPQQQCYGPGCVKSSSHGSKYCSDECGMRLAATRIFQILPQRIQMWSLTSCVAEENSKKKLEDTRNQLKEVRRLLKELDQRNLELDKMINEGKQCKVDDAEDREEEDQGAETSLYCFTCGHEIHSRTALRHMEKCFNKYEALTSFGSIYKSGTEHNMFCDFFNPTNATYCKRLKVLCPEHSKEPKPNPNEVCGFPLLSNVFEKTGIFCRTSKLNCMKHYSWERLYRAEIDMERVRQWMKLDELIEKEREIRHEMANRGGVLPLMLHSTYNHEVMDQLSADNA